MTDESKMTERRPARRPPAKLSLDTAAYDVAIETRERLEGHKELDTERFENLRQDIDDVKGAVHAVDEKQERYHGENRLAMAKMEGSLQAISVQWAATQGQSKGVRVLSLTIKDWVIVLIGAATLALAIMKAMHS